MANTAQSDGSLTARFMKSVGRHFVTLSCVRTIPGVEEEKIFVFSGFLIDVKGVWFYVTAGHILRDLRTAIGQGAKFDVWRLGDQTAGSRFNNSAIPYGFDIDRWGVIEDDRRGLDFAVVSLEELYCRQLHAGGAVPIAKDAWGDHVMDHDYWALVGVPSETVTYDGKTLIEAKVVVAPLEPVDPPATAGSKAENQFYGHLKDDSIGMLRNVDGMSGGPVFSVKKVNGTWKYMVIGVQSAWYESSRVIAACPFSSFGAALEDLVSEVYPNDEANGHAI
jgi:hypothetical protein